MTRCPACRGVLQLQRDAETETVVFVQNPGGMPYLEQRRRAAVVVFCSGCEYARELRPEAP